MKSLEDQLQRMCAEIEHDGIEVNSEFASEISEIMEKATKMHPHLWNLFGNNRNWHLSKKSE